MIIATILSGCGGNGSQQSSAPTQNLGTTGTTLSSKPETIVPEKLNNAEIMGPDDPMLEMSEYPDLKHMPLDMIMAGGEGFLPIGK